MINLGPQNKHWLNPENLWHAYLRDVAGSHCRISPSTDRTAVQPVFMHSPDRKPEIKPLHVGRPFDYRLCVRSHRWVRLWTWVLSYGLRFATVAARFDVSGVLEAVTNRFSANSQGCIDLVLGPSRIQWCNHFWPIFSLHGMQGCRSSSLLGFTEVSLSEQNWWEQNLKQGSCLSGDLF